MVKANDTIAIIVILYVALGLLLSICLCRYYVIPNDDWPDSEKIAISSSDSSSGIQVASPGGIRVALSRPSKGVGITATTQTGIRVPQGTGGGSGIRVPRGGTDSGIRIPP
jgi:hypothetical protein